MGSDPDDTTISEEVLAATVTWGYWTRLALLTVCTALAAALGSMMTWLSGTVQNFDPLVSVMASTVFAMGPALVIAVTVESGSRGQWIISIGSAVLMLYMWFGFGQAGDDPFGSLVFHTGWVIGIPAALAM